MVYLAVKRLICVALCLLGLIAPACAQVGQLGPGQIWGNYSSQSPGIPLPVNPTPSGTSCPTWLTTFSPFVNNASNPATLSIYDGAQCVAWGSLDQIAHSINGSFGTLSATGAASFTGGATISVMTTANAAITGGSITGMPLPVNASDVATKQYVDNSAVGLTPHTSAIAATTADLGTVSYNNGTAGVGATITNGGAQAAFSVDGVSPSSNARILVKNQNTAAQNGIYTLTTVGSGATNWVLTRATDANTPGTNNPNEIGFGTYILVTTGTANAGTSWSVNSTVTTIGTDAINWAQFLGGAIISSVSNSDSTLTVSPTTGAVVASLNLSHANTWSAQQTFSTGNINQNILNAQTSAYAAVSGDCGKTITLGGSAFYTLTIGAASGFTSQCTIVIVNIDTGRAKKMSVTGLTFPYGGFLWPGRAVTLKNESGTWTITSDPGIWLLSSSLSLFADSTNGSDTNSDCLASGTSACATVTHAAQLFCKYMRKNGQAVAIHTPGGFNQVENVSLCSYTPDELLAQSSAPTITGAAIVPVSGVPVAAVNVNTPWNLSSIAIQAPNTSTTCVNSDINSLIYVTNVTFYTCGIVLQMNYGGKIELNGGITLNSNVAAVVSTGYGGVFISAGQTITCNTIGSVSVFASSSDNGSQNWAGTSFSGCGSVVGTRFSATLGGGIDTNGGGGAFFPGNAAGSATSPGWYN